MNYLNKTREELIIICKENRDRYILKEFNIYMKNKIFITFIDDSIFLSTRRRFNL